MLGCLGRRDGRKDRMGICRITVLLRFVVVLSRVRARVCVPFFMGRAESIINASRAVSWPSHEIAVTFIPVRSLQPGYHN